MNVYINGVLTPPADAGSLDGVTAALQPTAGKDGQVVTFNEANDELTLAPATGGFPNPMSAEGDVIIGGVAGAPIRLPVGATGYFLRSAAGRPAWREYSAAGLLSARPAAAAVREGMVYWATDAAAGSEGSQCVHQGGTTYAWVTLPYGTPSAIVQDGLDAIVGAAPAGYTVVSDGAGGTTGREVPTAATLGLGAVIATGATAAIARAVINTASSGTLAARPASPAAGDSYLATDYDVLLTCAVAGTWRVVGADVMNVTMGPFSGATTQTSLLSATGTGNGPVGGPGYTYAACVYITGTPVIPQIIAGYIDSIGISGWALKMGDTSGKFGLYQRGMLSNATADLGSAVGTGPHAVAVACAGDGLSLRYAVDGGAVGTVAITGTYTVPGASAAVGVGNTLIASQPFIAGGISWGGVWSSVLSDADLQAVSAQYASGLPGAASTSPAWAWLCAKYPDGAARHMPIGSAAKPLVVTDTTRLLARTAR